MANENSDIKLQKKVNSVDGAKVVSESAEALANDNLVNDGSAESSANDNLVNDGSAESAANDNLVNDGGAENG